MAINRKEDPVGLDKEIDALQVIIYDGLADRGWLDYESYHRAYKNDKTEFLLPEIFEKDNNYQIALMNDDFTVTSFFIGTNTRDVSDGGLIETTVSIIFQANLEKLYPTAPNTQRFDEELITDVSAILNDLGGRFTFESIATTIDEVYAGFDTEEMKKRGDDMQKFNVARFDVGVIYEPSCSDDFASTTQCQLSITGLITTDETSMDANDGTATVNHTTPQGNISYLWTTVDGNIPVGEEVNKSMSGLSPGTYTVVVTDDFTDDCKATDSGTVNAGVGQLFAADFSGSDYFSSTNPIFDKSTSPFSFSLWFRLDSTAFSQTLVSKWLPAGNQKSYLLQYNVGATMRFLASHNGSTNTIATSGVTIVADTWYFVVGIYYPSTNEIGLTVNNETIVKTTIPSGGVFNSSAEFNVGQFDGGVQMMNGRIDSLSSWSKAFTQPDSSTLYNSGDGQTYADMSKVSLDAHYKMNELTGTRIDLVGGFNLTDNNSVGRAEGKILD